MNKFLFLLLLSFFSIIESLYILYNQFYLFLFFLYSFFYYFILSFLFLSFFIKSGSHLLSHTVSSIVSSAD